MPFIKAWPDKPQRRQGMDSNTPAGIIIFSHSSAVILPFAQCFPNPYPCWQHLPIRWQVTPQYMKLLTAVKSCHQTHPPSLSQRGPRAEGQRRPDRARPACGSLGCPRSGPAPARCSAQRELKSRHSDPSASSSETSAPPRAGPAALSHLVSFPCAPLVNCQGWSWGCAAAQLEHRFLCLTRGGNSWFKLKVKQLRGLLLQVPFILVVQVGDSSDQ